jgi:hypothetical protein
MSSKIEIDRKQLETVAHRLSDIGQSHLSEPLFALLLAPVVERQPVAIVDEGDDGLFIDFVYGEDGNPLRRGDILYTAPPELAELQATIARLTAEIEDWKQGSKAEADAGDEARAEVAALKGRQGEPVAWAANSDLAAIKHGALWSGTLWGKRNPPMLEGRKPLYTSQPAPVSVLPDNLLSHRSSWLDAMDRLVELEPISHEPDSDDKGFWEHERKAMHDMYDCLDKVKEMKQ